MTAIETALNTATELADAGRHADVISELSRRPARDLDTNPALALLLGTAQARMGHPDEGLRWVESALRAARATEDRATERRALNTRGAIAFVTGRIEEAADYYTQGLLAASRDNDLDAIGRCSNNIGIVNDLRGRHAEAISAYTMAAAAFERVGRRHGVAQCHHNLAITYREQCEFDQALVEATRAINEAEATGDSGLTATALRGRAEIRIAQPDGNLVKAEQEVNRALEMHRAVKDDVEIAEDLRILAAVYAITERRDEAESTLGNVIERAQAHDRPQLVAESTRDLAYLLDARGRSADAHAAARTAQAIYTRLGAEHELRKLARHPWDEDFAAELARSLEPLQHAQSLADRGHYHDLLGYLDKRSADAVDRSPTLALLRGIAHARLGQLDQAQQWSMAALTKARSRGDRSVEVRALNVCGVVALERGGLSEAMHFFTKAQEESLRDGDMATVGRSANNLGIIANMQGDHDRAIGAYTTAIAAYQRARFPRGVAETEHNLGITHRERGAFADARQIADAAVRDADDLGDPALKAQALAGRAEIRVASGDARVALREAQRALEIHRELGDVVREAEDMRILALAHSALGNLAEAEAALVDVIDRATAQSRPLLVASAQRDLSAVLARRGDTAGARSVASDARGGFARLNARHEVAKLDAFLADR